LKIEKKKKLFLPMLGETNNQFYMANMNIEFAVSVKFYRYRKRFGDLDQ
jgi:hypothetical protein